MGKTNIVIVSILVLISVFFVYNYFDTKNVLSFTYYKDSVCKLEDCYEDTGSCDVRPNTELSEEELECKEKYDGYVKTQENNNKTYGVLMAVSIPVLLIYSLYMIRNKKIVH